MKPIKKLLKYTKSFFKSKVPAQKACGSLLYKTFSVFIDKHIYKNKQKTIKESAYKAINQIFYNGQDFLRSFVNPKLFDELKLWFESSSSNQSKKPIFVRIDGTKLGMHYGKNIPELKWLYDYVHKCKINTHELYILLISIGNKDFIADFEICKQNYNPHKIAKKLLNNFSGSLPNELKDKFKKMAKLSLDGAWGHGSMLSWLKSENWDKIAVKSAGIDKVMIEGQLEATSLKEYELETIQLLNKHPKKWKTFNKCHNLNNVLFHFEKGYLPSAEIEISLLLLKFPAMNKNQKDHYLLLLSLPKENDWHHYQILQTYKGRWGIETLYRTSKQIFEINKINHHTKRKISYKNKTTKEKSECQYKADQEQAFIRLTMTVSIKLIGYMVLNWYRVENTRPSKTSQQQIVERFEMYFRGLSSNDFQKLFSG